MEERQENKAIESIIPCRLWVKVEVLKKANKLQGVIAAILFLFPNQDDSLGNYFQDPSAIKFAKTEHGSDVCDQTNHNLSVY